MRLQHSAGTVRRQSTFYADNLSSRAASFQAIINTLKDIESRNVIVDAVAYVAARTLATIDEPPTHE